MTRVSLPFGDERAVAGRREEAADAGAGGANPLRERALRHQLHLELAGQVLPLELLVLADVGRDHLPDLARLQQDADAEVVDAGVVADDGEVLRAARVQRGDQVLGNAAQAEPAHQDRRAVGNERDGRLGARQHLVHGRLHGGSYRTAVSASAGRVEHLGQAIAVGQIASQILQQRDSVSSAAPISSALVAAMSFQISGGLDARRVVSTRPRPASESPRRRPRRRRPASARWRSAAADGSGTPAAGRARRRRSLAARRRALARTPGACRARRRRRRRSA